ncbi:hypothetical protein EV361DRAFT_1013124, partial [Lentinula raphanica]
LCIVNRDWTARNLPFSRNQARIKHLFNHSDPIPNTSRCISSLKHHDPFPPQSWSPLFSASTNRSTSTFSKRKFTVAMTRSTTSRALAILFVGAAISSGVLAAPTSPLTGSNLRSTEAQALQPSSSSSGLSLSGSQLRPRANVASLQLTVTAGKLKGTIAKGALTAPFLYHTGHAASWLLSHL